MSKFRILFRTLLMVFLIGFVAFVAWAAFNSNPDRHWKRAQAAKAEENIPAAIIHLQNLIARDPNHVEGRMALAEIQLDRGEKEQNAGQYNQGVRQLAEAAKLRPDDTQLQRKLLEAAQKAGRLQTAADAAKRILAKDPNDVDALHALAVRAVQTKSRDAGDLLDRFAAQPSPRQFQALGMAEVYYRAENKNDARRQEVLSTAVERANELTAEQIAQLSNAERDMMLHLLLTSLANSVDASAATARANQILDACGKFPAGEEGTVAKLGQVATQTIGTLVSKYPVAKTARQQEEARKEVLLRAEKLQAEAIVADKASPDVYLQMATLAFSRNELQRTVELAQQGVAAAEASKTPGRDQVVALRLLAARALLVQRQFKEAKEQADLVLASPDVNEQAAGWAQLILGSVATAENRLENALEDYRNAEKNLGQTGIVQMALANTFLAMRQWKEALPYLQALHGKLQAVNPEEQFHAQQHAMTAASVHFGELRAKLALDQWKEAQANVQALRGTLLESQAEAAAAVYLWVKGRQSEASQWLNQARRKQPNDFLLILVQVGFLQQAGREDEARKLLEESCAAAPEDLRRQVYLVRWLNAKGLTEEAQAKLSELSKQFVDHPAIMYLQAEMLMAQGNQEDAMKLAEQLQQTETGSSLGTLLAAGIELQRGELDDAAKLFGEVSDRVGGNAGLELALGQIASANGDYVGAIDRISNSLDVTKLRGRSRFALLRAVLLLALKQGPAEAEKVLAPVIEQHGDDPFVMTVLADLRFKQGKFDEGMKLLNEAERLAPTSADIPYIKAGVLSQIGRIPEALTEIERTLQKNPKSLPALSSAASLNLALGKNAAADQYAQTALEINPQLWGLYLVRAEALSRMNRTPEAMQIITELLKKQPENLAAHRALVSLNLTDKKPEAALQACRKARAVLPDAFELVADEVALLCMENRVVEAKRLAEDSVGDPADFTKSVGLSQTFSSRGQSDLARQFAQQALDVGADDQQKAAAHLLLGEIALAKSGQGSTEPNLNETARDHFAAVLEVNPRNFVAGNNLAWILATEFNQAEEAASIVDRVRGDAPVAQLPINFVDTVAEVYRRANRAEDARELLTESLALIPAGDAKLLYQLGLAQIALNQPLQARNSLERAIQLGLSPSRTTEAERQLIKLDDAASRTQPDSGQPAVESEQKATE